MRIRARLRKWWEGKFVPPVKSGPDSEWLGSAIGRREHPWLRKAFEFSLDWLRANCSDIAKRFIVGAVLALFGFFGLVAWNALFG